MTDEELQKCTFNDIFSGKTRRAKAQNETKEEETKEEKGESKKGAGGRVIATLLALVGIVVAVPFLTFAGFIYGCAAVMHLIAYLYNMWIKPIFSLSRSLLKHRRRSKKLV
jgi:Flp pilus assembly protein TadB